MFFEIGTFEIGTPWYLSLRKDRLCTLGPCHQSAPFQEKTVLLALLEDFIFPFFSEKTAMSVGHKVHMSFCSQGLPWVSCEKLVSLVCYQLDCLQFWSLGLHTNSC